MSAERRPGPARNGPRPAEGGEAKPVAGRSISSKPPFGGALPHSGPGFNRRRPARQAPEVFTPAPELNPHYNPMFQGPGTNRLVSISSRRDQARVDPITGQAVITKGDLTVFIDQWSSQAGSGLRVSTFKLLDICALVLTSINKHKAGEGARTQVAVSLDDYMRICGVPATKPSKDKARRKVKEDLEVLFNISLEWSEPLGGSTADYAKMRVITSQGIKNGQILVNFSPEMAAYLSGAYIMQYPMGVLKIDERNPAAYHFGRKLALHHSMDQNQARGTANIISVKALLASAPDIPSHAEVAEDDRHFDRRIRGPFNKAMEALEDMISWEFCNSKGLKLTEEQLADFSYAVFKDCYIKFTIKGAPDQAPRLLAKARQRAEQEKKRGPRKKTKTGGH